MSVLDKERMDVAIEAESHRILILVGLALRIFQRLGCLGGAAVGTCCGDRKEDPKGAG